MRFLKFIFTFALLATVALPSIAQDKGLREGPPSGVQPPGEGPIPKGKSDIIDDVLKYNGWQDCNYWGGVYWCSPKKKR